MIPEEVADLAIIFPLNKWQLSVTEVRHVQVHRHRMTSVKLAAHFRANCQSHLDALTSVVPGASDFCADPLFTHVLTPQFPVCLKSTAAKYNGIGIHGDLPGG